MSDIMQWAILTPSERDAIVGKKIMGCPGAYTTDLNAAYLVVEEMVRIGCFVSVFQGPGAAAKTCSVWDAEQPAHIAKQVAETVPEAICLAAVHFFAQQQKPAGQQLRQPDLS